MASEQTRARKKQSRNSKEESRHPLLYRHQDCIPNPKLLQNCERHTLGLKNSQELECQGKLLNEHVTNDLKNKTKQLSPKLKNDGKSEKCHQGTKLNSQQPTVALGNNEELSKSRKRRLRKRRLLVALAPSISNNTKLPVPVENTQQTKPVSRPIARPISVVPPPPSSSSVRSTDPAKTSSKDPRKRLDKSVGSRNKSIKSKSLLIDSTTNQSKADIIKTLEEKTLNSLLQTLVPLTNSSPKKEKPCVPLFSFPEKRLSSSDSKVDKDGVFYFGETKHQLEKLTSGFNKYNSSVAQDKSESVQNSELNKNFFSASKFSNLGNYISPFKFTPIINDRLSTLTNVKQSSCNIETVSTTNKIENKSGFATLTSDCKSKETVQNTQILKDLNLFPVQSINLSKPTSSLSSATNSSGTFENNTVKTTNNIVKTSDDIKPIQEHNNSSSFTTSELGVDTKSSHINLLEGIKSSQSIMKSSEEKSKSNKTREEIMLEREAKKQAKLAAKAKHKTAQPSKIEVASNIPCNVESSVIVENQKDVSNVDKKDIELDKVKSCEESEIRVNNNTASSDDRLSIISAKKEPENCNKPVTEIVQDSSTKSKAELKAERRAKQEAQRAAKVLSKTVQPQPKEKILPQVKKEQPKPGAGVKVVSVKIHSEKKPEVAKTSTQPKPKLFSHLFKEKTHLTSNRIPKVDLHPVIVRLGVQYATREVVGSNARCIALLHALKQVVNNYTTPPEKEFSRGLEEELGPVTAYLNQCRPLAVSMTNALRHIKRTLTQLPNTISDVEARRKICDVMETYMHEEIYTAGKQICNTVKEKISDGDVILTYGCSSLIYKILVESHLSKTKFRVVIVDGLPWREGQEMLDSLVAKGVSCTYVLITAASFIMQEATKVLLGAHAILANGYVMSRAGSSQVALLAHRYNVPVLVCCETHKFYERVQTDAFVYNELGVICCDKIKDKEKGCISSYLTPLSLAYDITPPDLVSAVVTEKAVVPCTSVPVILRIKPSESVM